MSVDGAADGPGPAARPAASRRRRTLVIIPARNEAPTIGEVLTGLRRAAPGTDRLVVSDASTDGTDEVVRGLGERLLALPCHIGYGPAIQAGLRYATLRGYGAAVFVDADGQHRPADVPRLLAALEAEDADLVIGARFGPDRPYAGPAGRRLGQVVFSTLTRALLGRRIWDTTSGLKAVRARAFGALLAGAFMDFHTETIVRLSLLGYRIVETPITVEARRHGRSMHSLASAFGYPLKTSLLTVAALLDAILQRRRA